MSKEYKFHEAADIFPLDEEGLEDLAADIQKQGQQNAIELLDDQILDGRRRYLACAKAGITPRFIEVDIEDPVDYVLSINLHRRHLTPGQRAIVAVKAAKLKEKYAAEAKERQREGGKIGRQKQLGVVENLPPPQNPGKTRDRLGEKFGVSGRSVESATRVLERGTPALKKAVDIGLIAVSTAEKISAFPEEDQDKLVEQTKQAVAEGRRSGVRAAIDKKRIDNKTDNGFKGVGILYAHEAINRLKLIPKDDAFRKDGFQIVVDWIRHNK